MNVIFSVVFAHFSSSFLSLGANVKKSSEYCLWLFRNTFTSHCWNSAFIFFSFSSLSPLPLLFFLGLHFIKISFSCFHNVKCGKTNRGKKICSWYVSQKHPENQPSERERKNIGLNSEYKRVRCVFLNTISFFSPLFWSSFFSIMKMISYLSLPCVGLLVHRAKW